MLVEAIRTTTVRDVTLHPTAISVCLGLSNAVLYGPSGSLAAKSK